MSTCLFEPNPAAGLLVENISPGSILRRHSVSAQPGARHRRVQPFTILGPALLIVTCLLGTLPSAKAFSVEVRTDANIVTAIDVSDSIGRHEEWLQQTRLVRALVHPDFLRAATAGPHRQIGFAVFTW